MRILILANNDVGLYKFRRELVEELLKKYEVYIALPSGEFIIPLVEQGCKYIDIEFDRRGTNPISDFRLLVKYISIIKQVNPDIVLTYTIKPTIYGGIASRIRKVKYIANITGLGTAVENPGILQKIILLFYRIALKNAVCVFFQNAANKKYFESKGLLKGKGYLIPGSGVNIEEHFFEPYPHYGQYRDNFLFIGRIMKDKGVEELFDAAKKIKMLYPNITFDIIGGSDEDYSETIKDMESCGVVKYGGQQADVHPFYKKCNAVILPSYHEGMANVLLEASSTGRPVLASNIPGCIETFDEGITGFGFSPKSTDELFDALKCFVELDYDKKIAMGKAAREKVEREFDRRIVLEAYMKELELLNKNLLKK